MRLKTGCRPQKRRKRPEKGGEQCAGPSKTAGIALSERCGPCSTHKSELFRASQALCRFQSFLTSSACAVSATSYHFSSIAPLLWRSAFARFAPVVQLWRAVVVAVSNPAVKRTGLQPAAYFVLQGLPHKSQTNFQPWCIAQRWITECISTDLIQSTPSTPALRCPVEQGMRTAKLQTVINAACCSGP